MKDNKPLCFIIMPFGKDGTSEHQKYLTVYELIIKKPIEEAGFECERGDEIPDYGPIPEQIKDKLVKADLVLADLSGRNPNVFYELGYRHALNRATISISDNLDGLPFNVATYRTIQYKLDNLRIADKCRETIYRYAIQFRKTLEEKETKTTKPESTLLQTELEKQILIGLSNIYQLISELPDKIGRNNDLFDSITKLDNKFQDQHQEFKNIQNCVSDLTQASKLITQTTALGLVSIHLNRLDAIEHEFYKTMQEETDGISIVGSTIFGLKGYRYATFEKIVNLLKEKADQSSFTLRILLTHWDYISFRQDQEKTDKNIARYVISKELLQAVELFEEKKLDKYIRFYRGSPTCFTIVCEGQKLMLVNPYPYEREAFNSWTVVFREAMGGVYNSFKSFHVDQPWDNPNLTVSMSDICDNFIRKRFQEDVERAEEDMKKELGSTKSGK